jgi:hypothetical protein
MGDGTRDQLGGGLAPIDPDEYVTVAVAPHRSRAGWCIS